MYKGPSGRMGEPDDVQEYICLEADDLRICVSREVWDKRKPGQSKLLVAVAGYGRFWLHLDAPAGRETGQGKQQSSRDGDVDAG